MQHWPAKLLNGADVNDSVVEVVHELWHVLVQELLVRMHRVTCRKRNHRMYDCRNLISRVISQWLQLMLNSISPARGHCPGGVCCLTKDRNSYSACSRVILLSCTAWVSPDWDTITAAVNITKHKRSTDRFHGRTLQPCYVISYLLSFHKEQLTFPWCSIHHSDIPSSSSFGWLIIKLGPCRQRTDELN